MIPTDLTKGETMKKLPKTIYVKWEDGGDGEQYMVASEDWDTHAALGEKHLVGTYQLITQDHVISETRKVPAKRS